jgi:short-subunit dehydrogenase
MKKAIIIGASSGIGKGLTQVLSKEDYIIAITARRGDLLNELKAQNKAIKSIKAFDVSDLGTIAQNLESLVQELGGLDLVVISAGTGDLNQELDFELEKNTIQTNVLGFTFVADWAFNYFQTQKSGHLVAITSIAGLRGSRVAPAYNATKSYQINYLEGLRQKATKLKLDIFVTDVRPGFVDTDMAKGEGKFWVSTVEKASKQITDAIKKKKKIVYVTKRWLIIALILKCIPRAIYSRM